MSFYGPHFEDEPGKEAQCTPDYPVEYVRGLEKSDDQTANAYFFQPACQEYGGLKFLFFSHSDLVLKIATFAAPVHNSGVKFKAPVGAIVFSRPFVRPGGKGGPWTYS